ncbi:hypothetical protein RJ639_006803 [Escallonia herrerae]|uniref:Aluminum-activated malate transporter n=1 Tax=Escallonia herrerae TaxID=1293975 RepID=A0AA88VWJ3_9ASTE|nr:hypothetical protein RJ639_006803 [Escallonia herrerae]
MEMGSGGDERSGLLARGWLLLKALPEKFKAKMVNFVVVTKKLGQDDPRRVIHSLKVGLALSLVSLFYYFETLFNSFGVHAMWAIMTVVVVFEFSVGATLGKGLNRAMATLVAGALGVGAHYMASISGNVGEPIILGIFVFFQAAVSTFIRFFPKIKARYDYGLLIFILTFALVSISGFREDEILEFAQKRLATVVIGACACVIVSIFVCPVWAGQDLHNLISLNMEKLGTFLEGFGNRYFGSTEDEEFKDNESFVHGYKSVLNSKTIEETLANFARWEPGHGRFMYRHPWKQYLKVGTLTRQCAYRIEALNGFLSSDIQVQPEFARKIQDTCTKMSLDSGKALKELALAVKTMTRPSSADSHVANLKTSTKNLRCLLKCGLGNDTDLLKVIPVTTVASLLIDVAMSVEEITASVNELASLAHFKQKAKDTNLTLEKRHGVLKSLSKQGQCSRCCYNS